MEVEFDLVEDENSESGYLWTSIVGDHKPVTPGSFCTGSIVIRQECGVNRDGSNAKNILRAARKLGMEGKERFVPADELTEQRRIDDVRAYPIDKLNFGNPTQPAQEIRRLSGDVELKNVTFGYSPLDPSLLENFNMHLKVGNRIAIVGYSGSGKSTLAKIVTGLYEEWSGEILFDGKKRQELPRATLVNSIASVDQDVFHLNGTVQENITLFDSSIKKSDVIQAAKDACIHEDILKLEGGYDGIVSEGGTNFSGGQRQRLEIARALVRNPSILILDEATSALDIVTEKKLLDNIRRRGCSCILRQRDGNRHLPRIC